MKQNLEAQVPLLEGTTVTIESGVLTAKGPKGEVKRKLPTQFTTEVKGDHILFKVTSATKREKKILYTYVAHVNNMVKGVKEAFLYKLKVCNGHFPMKVAVKGNTFTVQNFLGEKVPRICEIPQGVKVTVNGNDIEVESASKELAGQTASNLEQLTRICDKDRRIFQDGIFITEKAGKTL